MATEHPALAGAHAGRSPSPGRVRRVAAAGRLRRDGRPGHQRVADLRGGRRRRGSAHHRADRPGRAWPRARSRWPPGSTSRCPRRTSWSRPRWTRNGTSSSTTRRPSRPSWPPCWPTAGVSPATARQAAAEISAQPDKALAVHALEELGIDPGELPSPLVAAGASLAAFAVGALIPLLGYLAGLDVLGVALGLAAVASVAGGGLVARLTGRPFWRGALRQLALGAACGRDHLPDRHGHRPHHRLVRTLTRSQRRVDVPQAIFLKARHRGKAGVLGIAEDLAVGLGKTQLSIRHPG